MQDVARPSLAAAALCVCALATAVPIVLVALPPVMDLPNHLARIWLLGVGAAQAPLSPMYRVDFGRAGMTFLVDAAAAELARFLPIFVVSKILLLFAIVGPPLAGALLNRAVAGRWTLHALALFAAAWSTTAIAGFVNFQISLFVALLCATFYSGAATRSFLPAVAIHLCACLFLLMIHPLGSFFYVCTTLGLGIGANLSWDRDRLLSRLAPPMIAFALAMPVFFLAPKLFGAEAASTRSAVWASLAAMADSTRIATILSSPFLSYDVRADAATAAPLVLLLLHGLGRRQIGAHAGLALVAGGLFALSLLSPEALGDGSWLPQRFPIMAVILFLASLRPAPSETATFRRFALFSLVLLILARTLWIGGIWVERQADTADVLAAIRGIPAGSSVISLQQEWSDSRSAPTGRFMIGSPGGVRATGRHLGGLAVIFQQAFLPTLFTVPGQQPLDVADAWRSRSTVASSIPYPQALGLTAPGDPYLNEWRAFDYVLLLNADLPTQRPFSDDALRSLELTADFGFARLYRIRR